MKRKIFPQLDGLRGLAALIVVAHHFWDGSARWDPTHGRIGVDIFFALSGYLITRSLLFSQAASPRKPWPILKRFHLRRILRIIPLFYLTLTLAWLLHWEKPSAGLWWHYGFLSNFLFIKLGKITEAGGHLWALAVEQQFYALWPFVVLFVPRKHLNKACIWITLIGLLGLLLVKAPYMTELSRAFLLTWVIGQATWGFPGWFGKAFESRLARALGNWSYGIYLSHNFFFGGFKMTGTSWGGLSLHQTQVIEASLATLLWSIACYTYLEKPLLRWSKSDGAKAPGNKALYSPGPTTVPSGDAPLAS